MGDSHYNPGHPFPGPDRPKSDEPGKTPGKVSWIFVAGTSLAALIVLVLALVGVFRNHSPASSDNATSSVSPYCVTLLPAMANLHETTYAAPRLKKAITDLEGIEPTAPSAISGTLPGYVQVMKEIVNFIQMATVAHLTSTQKAQLRAMLAREDRDRAALIRQAHCSLNFMP